MDVELAAPRFVSVDTLIAAIGLGIAGVGGYRIFTEVGTPAGVEGWVMLAVGFLFLMPRMFLELRLTDQGVEAGILTGTRSIGFGEIENARIADGFLWLRLGGTGTYGYHTGMFHLTGEGRVRAYTSRFQGPFVLLEREDGTPFVVSPKDPEAFLEALETRMVSAA